MIEPSLTFGAWLRQRREALGLTRKELAYHAGCSLSTIRKIEDGERRPSRQVAELLAGPLRIPGEQRAHFLQAARGERRADRLPLHPTAPVPPISRCVNVPAPTTPFIGRETELDEIMRALQETGCRLLTLTGAGGVGKTRLALEAARRCAAHNAGPFADGVCFVPLAGVATSDHILPAVADAAGFTFYGAAAPMRQLLDYLQTKRLLLVLDNLEHLLAGASLLAEILAQAPGVKLLVASRQRLQLQGEWVFAVPGLTYPVRAAAPDDEAAGAAALESYSAVALFVQCARRAERSFRLTAANRAAVLRICQLVEGLPLGLELAAAWMRTLPPAEIAAEIERDLAFLTASAPDLPERHRSLQAVFDHSWRLLTAEERTALARLAVFRGGFQRAAAQQVAQATLPLLSGLVEKSLVRHDAGRYDMHELTRQYAAARLHADPPTEAATRDGHSDYYLALLHAREADLRNARQKEALDELTAEIDNLRAAWDWALTQGRLSALRQATTSLMVYHELRNLFHEGAALFDRALATVQACVSQQQDDRTCQVVLADVRAQAAYFGFRLGRMAESQALLRQSLATLRQLDDRPLYAEVLWYDAFACWFGGHFAEADAAARESRTLNHSLGRAWQVAITSMILGGVAHDRGDYVESREQLMEALRLCRAAGDPRLISMTLSLLGRAHQALGQHAATETLLREGLRQATLTGDRYGIGLALEQLALIAHAGGKPGEAQRLLQEAAAHFGQIGDPWSLSRALSRSGWFRLAAGDAAGAQDDFSAALRTARTGGIMANALDALVGLAAAQVHDQSAGGAQALALALRVLEHPASAGETRQRAAHLRDELCKRLPVQEQATAAHHAQTSSTAWPLAEEATDFGFIQCLLPEQ